MELLVVVAEHVASCYVPVICVACSGGEGFF